MKFTLKSNCFRMIPFKYLKISLHKWNKKYSFLLPSWSEFICPSQDNEFSYLVLQSNKCRHFTSFFFSIYMSTWMCVCVYSINIVTIVLCSNSVLCERLLLLWCRIQIQECDTYHSNLKIWVSTSANQFVKIQTHVHHLLIHIHLDEILFGATIAYGMI